MCERKDYFQQKTRRFPTPTATKTLSQSELNNLVPKLDQCIHKSKTSPESLKRSKLDLMHHFHQSSQYPATKKLLQHLGLNCKFSPAKLKSMRLTPLVISLSYNNII